MSGPPERLDVNTRLPKTKDECEHYARYVWASTLARGEVLDVACGTGYGSALLARHAHVSGADHSEQAVEMARSRVSGTFLVSEMPPIPFRDNSFDFAVCFETIEHISDDAEFVREIRRVLRPRGILLLSSPNRCISAPGGVVRNAWHVREYTLADLTTLITEADLEVGSVFAQSYPPKLSRGHRIAWRMNGLITRSPAWVRMTTRALLGDAEVRPRKEGQRAPGYWLVSATKTV